MISMKTTRWLAGMILAISLSNFASALTLHIQTLTGVTFVIEGLSVTDKIETVKQRIAAKSEIAPESQRLIYGGKLLEDRRTLEECGIPDQAVLHLVIKQKDQPRRVEISSGLWSNRAAAFLQEVKHQMEGFQLPG